MENLLSLTLEAHNAGENHHRHYAVMVGRDLFNDWTVSIRHGRTGQAGRETRYAASQEEAMRAIIRDRLRRRLSAPKRIGCPYRLATFSVAPGFDAAAWLPGEIMAKFFQVGCQIAGKKECHLPGKLTHATSCLTELVADNPLYRIQKRPCQAAKCERG
jgi:predicted DNA-binding WGR domain protein